jgi:tRNA threonylcarbamoyladenosine biosynthesis protein TsaB
VRLAELDAIAFGRGPGAFTGLRTACSVAQGLAFGADKPVLPIDTLLAVAEAARCTATLHGNASSDRFRVWALLDARMGEIYAAQYLHTGAGWQEIDAPMLTGAEALNRRWQVEAPAALAGNALQVFAGSLRPGAVAMSFPEAAPTARAMLTVARALWAAGGAVDAGLALPLYLREKVAQTTVERDAARAAKDTAAVNATAAGMAVAP